MTDEMLALARRNAAEAGATNVEFLKGTIEASRCPTRSIDVVISNCVINLAADKPAVFREIARVLRPGGRIGHHRHRRRGRPDPGRARRARLVRRAASPGRSRSRSPKPASTPPASPTSRSRRPTRSADGMLSAIIRASRPGRRRRAGPVRRGLPRSRRRRAAAAATGCC